MNCPDSWKFLSKMGCFSLRRSKKKKPEQGSMKQKTPTEILHKDEPRARSLQSAPPSFKLRIQSSIQSVPAPAPAPTPTPQAKTRARPLSAPSSLDTSEFLNPKPLPLPSLPEHSSLKSAGSFKLKSSNPIFPTSGPLPLPPLIRLRNFTSDEIAAACKSFSTDGRSSDASFGDDRKLNATVFLFLSSSTPGIKEFTAEANVLATLQHPNLCKLLGFHAREGSNQRMLVYERLGNGSLETLLYENSQIPALDWSNRVKIALCAARALVFLHEEGPFQAMLSDFSTRNIQIDRDYTAKLTGHGCVSSKLDLDITNSPQATARLPEEALETSILTPKSNVWSFGLVLLELLTGRKNQDQNLPKEERDLIKWSRPYLADDCRLSLIMDPRLKGRFPAEAARAVADAALRCLRRDPAERPTMRAVAESLDRVQELKLCRRFPLQEPVKESREMKKFPSFNR